MVVVAKNKGAVEGGSAVNGGCAVGGNGSMSGTVQAAQRRMSEGNGSGVVAGNGGSSAW